MRQNITKYTLILLLSSLFCSSPAQYITNKGMYFEGTNYISTSRVEAMKTHDKFANTISLSLDFVKFASSGHYNLSGEYYSIQMNFYERKIGQKVLLKCQDGKIIELTTSSIQQDPFVQRYWLKENQIKEIINGKIAKIRILTNNSYVDRTVKDNMFSDGLSKCYVLIKQEIEKDQKERLNDFRHNF